MVKIKRGLLGELDALHQRMDRIMELVLQRHGHPGSTDQAEWCPAANLYETQTEVVVILEVAGVDPESLDVTLEETILRVAGSRPEFTPRQSCVALHQMEIESGAFERFFTVPMDLDGDAARARVDKGFLEIRIPKLVEAGETSGHVEVETG
ncbi:MAG: Hsp20/alpha crystallin family protein [Acidobacteriota bacterium]